MKSKTQKLRRSLSAALTLFVIVLSASWVIHSDQFGNEGVYLAYSHINALGTEGFNNGNETLCSGDTVDVHLGVFGPDGTSLQALNGNREASIVLVGENGKPHPDLIIVTPAAFMLEDGAATARIEFCAGWKGRKATNATVQVFAAGLRPASVSISLLPWGDRGIPTMSITILGKTFLDNKPEPNPDNLYNEGQGEPLINNAAVKLVACHGEILSTQLTNSNGDYTIEFEDADSTDFPCTVQLDPVSGYYQSSPSGSYPISEPGTFVVYFALREENPS